jgi:Fe-S cluster biogenesis protein NfuA
MSTGIEAVVQTFDEIVKPEGGSIKVLAVEGERLRVAYAAGVNEDCPQCVMEPEALGAMMQDMLKQHAPEITEVVVESA